MSNFIVGLTGGIGSGKSAVADLFRERGVAVVDADAISRELTATNGEAMPAIEATFGGSVIAADGALDRVAMRILAFADDDIRRDLEAILHPRIRHISIERCAAASSPYALLVVPLLIENRSNNNYRERCNRLLVVDCAEGIQIARVMARSRLSREDVLRVMAAQANRIDRLSAADDIIDNNGELDALPPQVAALHEKYLNLSRIT